MIKTTNTIIVFFKNLEEKQYILLLLGCAFGLRLYAVLMAKGITYDSAAYGFMARNFLKGDFIKGLSWAFHPLYPLLISFISPDSAHVEIVGRLISLFWGTITLIPLYYLVKETIDQKVAMLSTLLYTFHLYLVTYSGMMLTEATYWGLLVLSVFFFWTGLKKDKVWSMALSGFFLGLAYLTRPEGIGYIVIYLGWIIVDGFLKKEWLKKAILIGVLLISVFVLVVPYVMYLHHETGRWLISKKALGIESHLLKQSSEEETSLIDYKEKISNSNFQLILAMTRNIIKHLPSVAYNYVSAYHFSLWLFLLFGLIRMRKKNTPYELFIASLVLFHLFSLSTFTSSWLRFSIPVIPLSLFWAATGILEIKRRLEKAVAFKPEYAVFWLIILVLLINIPQSFIPERSHRAYQKRIGIWLQKNSPSDAIIMGNSPIETFYANREFIQLPIGISTPTKPHRVSYEEIIQYAKQKGVGFILINHNINETNPDFSSSINISDLKEFYRYQKDESHYVIIYEIL